MYPAAIIMIPAIITPIALILSFPGIFIILANAGIKNVNIPKSINRIPIPTRYAIMVSPGAFLLLLLNTFGWLDEEVTWLKGTWMSLSCFHLWDIWASLRIMMTIPVHGERTQPGSPPPPQFLLLQRTIP